MHIVGILHNTDQTDEWMNTLGHWDVNITLIKLSNA